MRSKTTVNDIADYIMDAGQVYWAEYHRGSIYSCKPISLSIDDVADTIMDSDEIHIPIIRGSIVWACKPVSLTCLGEQ